MITDDSTSRWRSAWPDALAFALGLAVAYAASWTTTDLVWSLWLSSLVVGYAMILWTIVRPAFRIGRSITRAELAAAGPSLAILAAGGLAVGGFMLAFFTVHFGGFHYVHSQFLHAFFPLEPGSARGFSADLSTYAEVVRRYWHFLPAAFIAERAGFRSKHDDMVDDLSVTAEAIARRHKRNAMKTPGFMAPYRNVVRMHFLIFFFAIVHAIGLEHFAVYTVVYAVYFFPFRRLRQDRPAAAPVGS